MLMVRPMLLVLCSEVFLSPCELLVGGGITNNRRQQVFSPEGVCVFFSRMTIGVIAMKSRDLCRCHCVQSVNITFARTNEGQTFRRTDGSRLCLTARTTTRNHTHLLCDWLQNALDGLCVENGHLQAVGLVGEHSHAATKSRNLSLVVRRAYLMGSCASVGWLEEKQCRCV